MGEKIPKIEAGLNLFCGECGKYTLFPLLKIVPGIKCEHCGAMLTLDEPTLAAKNAVIAAVENLPDVKMD